MGECFLCDLDGIGHLGPCHPTTIVAAARGHGVAPDEPDLSASFVIDTESPPGSWARAIARTPHLAAQAGVYPAAHGASGFVSLPATPSTVHPSHDVREEGLYISDPVCQNCRVGIESLLIFQPCESPIPAPARAQEVSKAPYDCRPCGCGPCTCPDGLCGKRPPVFDAKRDFATHPDFGKTVHLSPIPTDRWWAQRWIDKAAPGELAAMRELIIQDDGK